MLTELYIEALLVDEELADLVWEAWDSGLISDESVLMAWVLTAGTLSNGKMINISGALFRSK